MSIINSIGRGFGFTIGKNLANSFSKSSNKNSNSMYDWSQHGYQEGDVDFITSRNFKNDELSWVFFPFGLLISAIPYIGLLVNFIFLYKIVLKKHHIYFYDFKWETYTVGDRRTKSGTKEIKVLEKVLSKVEEYPTPLKNKIQTISCFIVSLLSVIIISNL